MEEAKPELRLGKEEEEFRQGGKTSGWSGVMLKVQGWGMYRTSKAKRMQCGAVQAVIREGRATSEKASGAR